MGGATHVWGKERVIHWLMQAQRASGLLEPELVAFAPALVVDVLREAGFPVTVLTERHQTLALGAITRLCATLREKAPVILHTHGYKANILARIARVMGAPMMRLISTSHGFDNYAPRLAWYNALDRTTGYLSTICTVTDPRMAQKFPPGVRVKYIANALPDAPAFSASQREQGRAQYRFAAHECVVGMLHRLIAQKGVAEFLTAARLLQEWGRNDIIFALAGDGPLLADVQCALESLRSLRYVGYVDPPDEYLAALDVFIQPSRSEGLSLALLQAMRAGRPIIATRVGATEEVLTDAVDALLIAAQDPHALALAIIRLADERAYAAQLAERARQRFLDHFQIERQHHDFLALYTQ